MLLEDAIYTYLYNQTAIKKFSKMRIYYAAVNTIPNGEYIIYQIISKDNKPKYYDAIHMSQAIVQFTVFSKSATKCLTMGNELVKLLNYYTGILGEDITVIFSTAEGTLVARNFLNEDWYEGIITWNLEYEHEEV